MNPWPPSSLSSLGPLGRPEILEAPRSAPTILEEAPLFSFQKSLQFFFKDIFLFIWDPARGGKAQRLPPALSSNMVRAFQSLTSSIWEKAGCDEVNKNSTLVVE